MSRYALPADLQRLAMTAAAIGSISPEDQQAALDAASAVADSYLVARFRLPLTAWADDLRRAVCQIAAYDLMSRRGYDPRGGQNETFRLRHEDAIRWLERVASGQVTPSVTETPPPSSGSGSRIISNTPRGW